VGIIDASEPVLLGNRYAVPRGRRWQKQNDTDIKNYSCFRDSRLVVLVAGQNGDRRNQNWENTPHRFNDSMLQKKESCGILVSGCSFYGICGHVCMGVGLFGD
jgi:hypothetical protein